MRAILNEDDVEIDLLAEISPGVWSASEGGDYFLVFEQDITIIDEESK